MIKEHPLTPEQVSAILDRSKDGESVARIINGMGLPLYESLLFLQRRHHDDVKVAKATFRDRPKNEPVR